MKGLAYRDRSDRVTDRSARIGNNLSGYYLSYTTDRTGLAWFFSITSIVFQNRRSLREESEGRETRERRERRIPKAPGVLGEGVLVGMRHDRSRTMIRSEPAATVPSQAGRP